MKNFLILDTSTEIQFFALVCDNKIKDIIKLVGQQNYVANCVPLMDQILTHNNMRLKDLCGLIVGIGPGSYTGIRVAVVTAKVIALNLKISLYKISSLLLLTSGYDHTNLTPLINARNDCFFSLSLSNHKIILPEGRYTNEVLSNYPNHIVINNDTIKLDVNKIFSYMQKVIDIYSFVPNYLIKI